MPVGLSDELAAQTVNHGLTFSAIRVWILAGGAAANWFIGKRMNAAEPRILLDPATNQQLALHLLHKLCCIRMENRSISVAFLSFVPLLALYGRQSPQR